MTGESRDKQGYAHGGDGGRAHACTVGEEMRGAPVEEF